MMVLGQTKLIVLDPETEVSILLVMDDGLGDLHLIFCWVFFSAVSILLVMDDGLGVGDPIGLPAEMASVSILLVMDDGLGGPQKPRSRPAPRRLNPSCNG